MPATMLKCNFCNQGVPDGAYKAHLRTEHGGANTVGAIERAEKLEGDEAKKAQKDWEQKGEAKLALGMQEPDRVGADGVHGAAAAPQPGGPINLFPGGTEGPGGEGEPTSDGAQSEDSKAKVQQQQQQRQDREPKTEHAQRTADLSQHSKK